MTSETRLLVEYWPIERIKPYEKNARKIPQSAIDKVAQSLREFGWRQPIVVDPAGVVVVGHVRRLGALQNNWTEAPVHIATDLNPAQIRQYRLMDNRSHDEAKWDPEMLTLELQEMSILGLDLAITGFSGAERDRALLSANPEEDVVPPAPAVPTSQLGDLWICGRHRVLCGDCLSPDAVGRLLGDQRPVLMVTDPPYGVQLDSEWRDRAGLNGAGAAEPSYMKHRTEGHTETTVSGDTRADWSEAFGLVPSLEVAYVWHSDRFTREVLNGLERLGFLYPQQIIWNKQRTVLTRGHYWFQHEPCWYVRKKNAPWFGKAGECSTIWDAASPKFIFGATGAVDKFAHPTQKPVELMRRSILNHTIEGQVVYEPFLGSGTTLAAAEVTGRACCGLEIEPRYVDVVVQRWQKLAGADAVLEDGRTFGEVAERRKALPANQEGA